MVLSLFRLERTDGIDQFTANWQEFKSVDNHLPLLLGHRSNDVLSFVPFAFRVTAQDAETGARLARTLVEERLGACVTEETQP